MIVKSGSQDEAKEIKFNKLNTNLSSSNVQDAILEVNNKFNSSGWKDNVGVLQPNNYSSETSPLYMDIGNGTWMNCFSDISNKSAFIDLHINHDYKIGSKVYPHIHWIPLSTSTGTVKWDVEYIIAKGHQQSEILTGALTKVSLTQNGKGLIGEHFIAEFNDSQAFTVPEPDTIVRMKITRDAESSIDTFYGLVAAFIVDIHYESDHNSTIGRLPNFDVITGAK